MKPFHSSIEKLDEGTCTKILAHNTFCHLGVTDGSECYVVPMSYVFEDGLFYCHSKEGKKLDYLRTGLSCCVQVEEVRDFYNWRSVSAICAFDELTGDELIRSARILISKLEHQRKISALEEDFASALETTVVFRLRPLRIDGRFEGVV